MSVLLIGLMAPGSIFASGAFLPKPFTSLVVISLGNDVAINHATDQIRMIIPGAVFLSASNEEQLRAITRMAVREIIYVGHGLPGGLEVGSSLISWQEVQAIVKESPAIAQMFAACYSLAANVAGKQVFGFKSLVDVDEAAMWVTTAYYVFENQMSKVPGIMAYFYAILLAKVINPVGQLLAFLGPPIPNCIEYTKQGSMVQPNGCGGCGCACYGCGPPPPTCNGSSQWINGYNVMYVDAICHVHYDNAYNQPAVYYTHPDNYVTYTWIDTESQQVLAGNGLDASHIPHSTIFYGGLAAAASVIIGGMVAGGIIGAFIGGPIGAVLGVIVGGIAALLGLAVQAVAQEFLPDERGGGWGWISNPYSAWYGEGLNLKMGKIMWFQIGITLGIPFWTPLWYGGQDLGINGW